MNTKELVKELRDIASDKPIMDKTMKTCSAAASVIEYLTKQMLQADKLLKEWERIYDDRCKEIKKLEKLLKDNKDGNRILYPY